MKLISITLFTLFVGAHCHVSLNARHARRRCEPPNHANGRPLSIHEQATITTQRDVLGLGWLVFAFGAADTFLPRHFEVESDRYIEVAVTDFGCLGDSFSLHVILTGGERIKIGATNMVRSDGCMLVEFSPEVAFESGQFSAGRWILKPGRYLLQLSVDASPYNGGTAAIKFEEVQRPIAGLPLIDLDGMAGTTLPAGTPSGGVSKFRKITSKDICEGDDHIHIIQTRQRRQKAFRLCAKYGLVPFQMSKTREAKRQVIELLHRCMNKKDKVWLGGIKGHGKSKALAVEYRHGDLLRIHEMKSSEKLPIICQEL